MFRRVQLPSAVAGGLFLHSMPGRHEAWHDFMMETRNRGIDRVVCLTDAREIAQKSPDYAAAIAAGNLAWQMTRFPIADYGVPEDRDSFARCVREVADHIQKGETVLLHCAGGVGRTGTFAICVLRSLGTGYAEARAAVVAAKAGPETSDQKALTVWHDSCLGNTNG